VVQKRNSIYGAFRAGLEQQERALNAVLEGNSQFGGANGGAISGIGRMRDIGDPMDSRRTLGGVPEQRIIPGLVRTAVPGDGFEPSDWGDLMRFLGNYAKRDTPAARRQPEGFAPRQQELGLDTGQIEQFEGLSPGNSGAVAPIQTVEDAPSLQRSGRPARPPRQDVDQGVYLPPSRIYGPLAPRDYGASQRPNYGSARVLRVFPQGVTPKAERPRSREANRGIRPLLNWSRDSVDLTDSQMTPSRKAGSSSNTLRGTTPLNEEGVQRMIEATNGGIEPDAPSLSLQFVDLVQAADELRRSSRWNDDYAGDPAEYDPGFGGAGAQTPSDRPREQAWDTVERVQSQIAEIDAKGERTPADDVLRDFLVKSLDRVNPAAPGIVPLAKGVYIDSKGRPVRQSPDVVDTMAAYSVVEVPYLGADGKIRQTKGPYLGPDGKIYDAKPENRRVFVHPGETAAVVAPADGAVVRFGGKVADADASAPWDRTLDLSSGGLSNEARTEARTPTISGWGLEQAVKEGRFTPVASAEEGGPIQGSTKLIGYLVQPAQRTGRGGAPAEAIEVWDYGGEIEDLRVEPGQNSPQLMKTNLYRLGNKMSMDADAFRSAVRQSLEIFPGMGQVTPARKVSPRVVANQLARGELAVVMENADAKDPGERFKPLTPVQFDRVMQVVDAYARQARAGVPGLKTPSYRLYAVPPGTDPQALQAQRVPGQLLTFDLPPSGAWGRPPVQITLGDSGGPVYVGPSDFANESWQRKAGERAQIPGRTPGLTYGSLFERLNDLTPGKFMEDAPIIAPSTLSRRLLQVGVDRRQADQGGMQISEILARAAQSGAGPTEMRDLRRALASASNTSARPVAPLVVADQEALRGAHTLDSMERAAAAMLAEVPDVEVVRAIAESQLPPAQKALASRALANVLARRSEDPERFAEENFELIQQDLNRIEEEYRFDPRENAGVGDIDSGEMIAEESVRPSPSSKGAVSDDEAVRNLGYTIEATGDVETAQLAAAARGRLMNPGFLSEGRIRDDVIRQALYLADAARRAGGRSVRPIVARTAAEVPATADVGGRTLEQLIADAEALANAPLRQRVYEMPTRQGVYGLGGLPVRQTVREPLVGGRPGELGGGPTPTTLQTGLPRLTLAEMPQFAWNVRRDQTRNPIIPLPAISERDALVNAAWENWAPGLKADQFANALSGRAGWDAVLKAQRNQALRLARQYGRTDL
jgi:hypothetical protein